MYIQTDSENNIIQLITVGECPKENGYEIDNTISEEILNNIFSYKYINNEFVLNDTSNSEKIKRIISKKIEYLSSACHKIITEGVIYNNKQYSLTIEDQFDIFMRSQQAQMTGESLTWHANDGKCELMTPEQFMELANLGNAYITFHTTYFNFLKQDIKNMTDIDKIVNVKYGDPLSEENQEEFDNYVSLKFDFPDISDNTNYNILINDIDINSLIFVDESTDEVENEIINESEKDNEDIIDETDL